MGADTCANGDSTDAEHHVYIIGVNPAEYDGTITDVYVYPNQELEDVRIGMMELVSAPIGGESESFKQGAGGDYDTAFDSGAGGACRHLVAGVDYTLFSCDEGEYAGIYYYDGNIETKTAQSGNTYKGYWDDLWYDSETQLESTVQTFFTRQDGDEIQMYFVNTL